MSQLYALLRNGQLRYIDLSEEIIEPTKELFVNAASELMNDETEEVEFDGRYVIRENENEISFITMDLPEVFIDIPENQQGLTTLDVHEDNIQSIFWYEEGAYFFQMFSSGNLLENKYILRFFQEQHNFTRMTDKAFIINNKIQAIYMNGRLYFKSFTSASKIFDLSEHMVEATTTDVTAFGNNDNITIDVDWLKGHANTKTRRLIKMISASGTLDTFMGLSIRDRKALTRSVNVEIIIENNKLKLPSNVGKVNKILEFLNEDVYKGLISSNIFRTNSKRPG